MRSNKRRILLLDMDDVLNDFNNSWINEYNIKYDQSLTIESITDWDLHKFTLPGVDVFKEFVLVNGFFRGVGVQPYAQEATRELLNQFDIYVVSASHFSTVSDKAEWLMEHFPHIPIKHFIPCYNKFMIQGDILVDDGFHNLVNFKGKRILFDKPWNRQYQTENILREHKIFAIPDWVDCLGSM